MSSMKTSATVESQRQGAEVHRGEELCKKKSAEILMEFHLPRGLLPLASMEEVGFNRETGFVWLRQPKATTHVFKSIGKSVSYATEVTGFIHDRQMSRVSGVKSKEVLVWVSISDMSIDAADSKTIAFKTPAGLSKSFPVSAFEEEN